MIRSMISRSLPLLLAGAALFGGSDGLHAQDQKNSRQVLERFSVVTELASKSTVEVLSTPRSGLGSRIRRSRSKVALGTIVGSDGLVLTKLSELPEEPRCRLYDDRTFPAMVVAVDELFDLALLRIQVEGLAPIVWSEIPGPYTGSLVISAEAERRPIAVGAVSIEAKQIASGRGFLGVRFSQNGTGASLPMVSEVIESSGAEAAGLVVGDLITAVDGETVRTRSGLIAAISGLAPRTPIILGIERAEGTKTKELEVQAVLGRHPDERESSERLAGAVSEVRDGFPSAFEHDSVLTPDEVGGPIVGLDGKAVGINIARVGRTASYAIPSLALQPVIARLTRTAERFEAASSQARDEAVPSDGAAPKIH